MKLASRSILLSVLCTFASGRAPLHAQLHARPQAQRASVARTMAGIDNGGRNGGEPYVTAGDRTYLIGAQDGSFPDMGGHVPGEMGGLWLHPIKLIDGFAATVTDAASGRDAVLSKSTSFVAYPYGSRFRYAPVLDGVTVERFQFSPDGQDGLVVQYRLANAGARARRLRFRFTVKTDLLPVWSSEQLGVHEGPDTVAWRAADGGGVFVAHDTRNPWVCVWGAVSPATGARRVADPPPPLPTRGTGATAASEYAVALDGHGSATLTFVIAGSATDERAALATYRRLARDHERLLAVKKAHYAAIVARSRVRIPDQRLQDVYDWVKVNTEWHVREVPGIGRGLGAGLMEYPWWFSDTYTVEALIASGDFELAKQQLRLLRRLSLAANHNGRIVHEVATNGFVSNPGNTQETAQYVLTIGKLIDWSGDTAFAREMYPAMTQGLDWLLGDMDRNHNLLPEGYGIMEVLGLNAEVIDVAVYTQQALEATARVARVVSEQAAAARYAQLAGRLKTTIDDSLWVAEDSSYGDFHGTRAQALATVEGAIKQIELKGPSQLTARDRESIEYYEALKHRFATVPDSGGRAWITNENWVIATPMERGIAPRARAIPLLDRIRRKNVGPYGPYLSAVERQAMMTISTGVQAVAEARYGRIDEAMWYVNRIADTFGQRTPGSISEMMPDYGCFTIAWTSYGVVIPLVQQVFGVQPDAIHHTVVLAPHAPTDWDDMAIADLPVGTTTISLSRTRTARGVEYDVEAKDDGWTFVLEPQDAPAGARYFLNGKPVSDASAGVRMRGRKNHVLVAATR